LLAGRAMVNKPKKAKIVVPEYNIHLDDNFAESNRRLIAKSTPSSIVAKKRPLNIIESESESEDQGSVESTRE